MSKLKLLINTPDIGLLGGVSNHYLGLKKHWSFNVNHNTIGSRYHLSGILLLPFDIVKFIIKCILFKPSVVLLNPSLGMNAIRRDAIFLKISKLLNLKTIVFFHGWDSKVELYFDSNPKKIRKFFEKADGFFVLSDEFRHKLQQWGIKSTIHL
ncbi:MAG: hypothetical protein JKX82_00570, partial [Oleispira sp.]|nr:hypothetical protein [Oleispira sp.]